MNKTTNYASYLRWYPRGWRERYGVEFVTLLEETYCGKRVPLKASISMLKSGVVEHAREAGVVGDALSTRRSIVGSAWSVLMAWAVFLIVGSVFAKYVEHWQWVTPANEQTLPSVAYDAVAIAALASAGIAMAAGMAVLPSFIRLIRSRGWSGVRAPLRASTFVGVCALVFSVGIVVWAHEMHDFNGAALLWPTRTVFYFWFAFVAAAIFTVAANVGTLTRRLELEVRVTRLLGALALAMNVVLVVIFVGILTWWGSIAANAPWFFSGTVLGAPAKSSSSPSSFTVVGSTNHVAPVLLIVLGLAMLGALLVAAHGAARISTRLRRAE